MLLLLFIGVVSTHAQLYPTLMQPRPIYLPSHLHQHLQFAGTVPVYEAVMPAQPQQTFVATSTAPVSTSPIYMQPMPQYGQPVPQMGHPIGTTLVQAMSVQQAYPYGYGYQQQKTEGPLKRFLRGAADGFMLGTMGWMG
ncbi:hypothetical protein Q1695_003162 [Nippostrongylus brasiliensis]|nr:hypothetical protein Q1695_003162 [Nippostrongylus brasiliensis]